MDTVVDAYSQARELASNPTLSALRMRPLLRLLLQDLDWARIQLVLEKATADDLEHRLDLVLEQHSDRVVDGGQRLCARCVELAPCRTERAARGVLA